MLNSEKLALLDIMQRLQQVAQLAGVAILDIYHHHDFNVQSKADASPVTAADLAAHQIIINYLNQHFPEIPCLSEESDAISFKQRQQWQSYFIIDPLDGTKEFIARNDDFTVNIALVHQGKPLIGVVYAPVFETLYFAAKGIGSFKQVKNEKVTPVNVRQLSLVDGVITPTILTSRRHGLAQAQDLCRRFDNYQLTCRGSSLKMCLIAEGSADFYPRLAPTCEWDTAAAQCILEQAGGVICDLDFLPLQYNQKESLLNPYFLAIGDKTYNWQQQLNLNHHQNNN